MHPEIEKLINLALADGQITEKERNVIFKKAAELGVDTDEVEVILEAKLHQLKPKKKKIEDLNTCPSCGEIISGLSRTCICGYVINSNDIKNSKSLEEAIETLENLIVKIRAYGKNSSKSQLESFIAQIEKEVRYIKTRYANNYEVEKLLKNLEELYETQFLKILNHKKRKANYRRISFSIFIVILGYFIFKIVSWVSPEELFKRRVTEKYFNSINNFKEIETFQSDSTRFFKLYDYSLRHYHTNKKIFDSITKAWNDFEVDNPTPYRFYVLSLLSKYNGDNISSKKYVDSCLVLFPNFAPIYNAKSSVSIEIDEKIFYLEKAIELDKNKKRYLFKKSSLLYEKKNYRKALDDIRNFNESYTNNFKSISWEIAILFDVNLNSEACDKLNSLKTKFKIEYQNMLKTTKLLMEKKCKEL